MACYTALHEHVGALMTTGEKLARARKRNGFKSRSDFIEQLKKHGCDISEGRLARIERDEAKTTTIEEIRCITDAMPRGLSLDWLFNDDAHAAGVIQRRLAELPYGKRRVILVLIDELFNL